MEIISKSQEKTKLLGSYIGENLSSGDIVGLFGELAVGKTILTKGILLGLGMDDVSFVNSPSFLIMQQYEIKGLKVYHFDFYRINSVEEAYNIGWDEILDSGGICIIEWAQNVAKIMPEEYLKINLSIENKSSRKLKIVSEGKKYEKVVKSINLKLEAERKKTVTRNKNLC